VNRTLDARPDCDLRRERLVHFRVLRIDGPDEQQARRRRRGLHPQPGIEQHIRPLLTGEETDEQDPTEVR
jgi:hypothetical protein